MPNTINTKNIFRKRKQFMRLCAIAMVEDSIIKPIESVVLDQIYDKIFDGCDDGAFIAELGDKYQNIKSSSPAMLYGALLTSDESMRRSMFMNIDAMNLEEVEAELKYIIQVITADDSVTDREREAFRVVCKLFKIKGSYKLWTKLYHISIDELNQIKLCLRKKKRVNVNDFKTIRKAIEFYHIQGPIIEGVYHVLQRELTYESEDIYHKDKRRSKGATVGFIVSAAVIYFFASFLPHANPECHKLCWRCITGLGNIAHQFEWLLILFIPLMMICVEWLIFMLEEYADKKDKNVKEKKHHGNSVLIVLVAAAIIADICIGLIELNGNLTLSTITTKVASALFLGCICFFVGKFINMRRAQKSIDKGEMKDVVKTIEKMINKVKKK